MKKVRALLTVCLLAGCQTAFAETVLLSLYFDNADKNPKAADCSKSFAVTRSVQATDFNPTTALKLLFAGPNAEESANNYLSIFAPDTAAVFKSVNIIGSHAYVNLSAGFTTKLSGASSSCGRDTFFSHIEPTLKQFKGVKKVFYAIEGKPKMFYSWMELESCPRELKGCTGKNFKR
jgi:spore germination protein GerM